MVVLYILLGIVALLALLISLPVVLRVTFDGAEPVVKLRYLFISYTVYPREKKEPGKLRAYFDGVLKKLREKKKERRRRKKPASTVQQQKKTTWQSLRERKGFFGAVGYVLSIVRQSAGLGAYLIRNSRISRMKVHIRVGGDDAAQIALDHGKWCAALYPALALVLSSVKGYRGNSVSVVPDFMSGSNSYDIDVKLRVKPFHGIVGAVRMFSYLVKAEMGERQAEYSLKAFEKAAESGGKTQE